MDGHGTPEVGETMSITPSGVDQLYLAEGRYYHNTEHIDDCLSLLDEVREQVDDYDALYWAIKFHDAIYNTSLSDNEEQSAELAYQSLLNWGRPEAFCDKVRNLIMDTKHNSIPSTKDGQFMADIDLASLGYDWDKFWANTSKIRQEFTQLSPNDFNSGMASNLQKFLDRENIYYTEYFRNRFEVQARENLQKAIGQLSNASN